MTNVMEQDLARLRWTLDEEVARVGSEFATTRLTHKMLENNVKQLDSDCETRFKNLKEQNERLAQYLNMLLEHIGLSIVEKRGSLPNVYEMKIVETGKE